MRLLRCGGLARGRTPQAFRLPMGLIDRRHASTSPRPFRMAIVGSGPAGFYAAARVMQRLPTALIDMYEMLPVPFGLVRYGVAPDHPEVKNCQERFEEIANLANFNFFGNMQIGKDISLSALRNQYHAVLFAYGASHDRELGIGGEQLDGIYSARSFVGWYNGLPEYAALKPQLANGDTAMVIGNGNVALDVARILLSSVDSLSKTDIAEYAIETLRKSTIKRVVVAGRRGPMQAAFTVKELRELLTLEAVGFDFQQQDLVPDAGYIAALPRLEQRRFRFAQLLNKGSQTPLLASEKSWKLLSLVSPHEFKSTINNPTKSGNVASMVYETNRYRNPDDRFERSASVAGTGELEEMECSAVFRSIGYQSEEIHGLSRDLDVEFDKTKGIIANDGNGRALRADGQSLVQGCYCAGWVQTGPTGVIATTMENAFAVAEAIVHDATLLALTEQAVDGSESLRKSGVLDKAVTWRQWKAIDAAEQERGRERGKLREKFNRIDDMLAIAHAG